MRRHHEEWYRLQVRVRGRQIDAFLASLVAHGVRLWDVRGMRQDQRQFAVRLSDLPALRNLAKERRVKARVLARLGLGFWLLRVGQRPLLLTLTACALLGYLYLASHVWTLQVVGQKNIPAPTLLRAAASLGLKPGVHLSAAQAAHVERALTHALPGLLWVGVHQDGTAVTIQVVERHQVAALEPTTPGDIVAHSAGLVTRIAVYRGTAEVDVGSTVVPGQVLILGREGLAAAPVHAAGSVWGRVWLNKKFTLPRIAERYVSTGRPTIRRWVVAFGRSVDLSWWQRPPTGLVRRTVAIWRNPLSPVEIVTEVSQPLRVVKTRWSAAQVRGQLRAASRLWLQRAVPKGAVLRQSETRHVVSGQNVEAVVTAEVEEEIGAFRPSTGG